MEPRDGLADSGAGRASTRIAALATLLGVLVLMASLAFGVYAAASRIDADARARDERLVANGVRLNAEEIRRSLDGNTIWDDAVAHLDNRFDPSWARDFIGQYFWRNNGYQSVYVLGADGKPLLDYEQGRVAAVGGDNPITAAAAPLIADIRAREAARGPERADDANPSAPIAASAIARLGGQPVVLAASLVQSDHSSGVRAGPTAPMVVVGERIDQDFVAKLNRRYLLDDLRVVPLSSKTPPDYDAATLRDARGQAVASLAWRPNRPASELLSVAAPTLAVAFLTLIAVATVLLRHEWRRNQALTSAMAQSRSASDAKSAFLATMSHEIRTPLNGVLGMTQAMAMDPLSPAQRARLDVVRQSGQALLAILNDVLDLSKIESGKLTLERIEFDLAEVMRGAHAAFEAQAKRKGLSFSLDISGAEGVYLGDPTRIRQILYNLISNALKFTAKGDIAVRAEAGSGELRLIVSDTGEGIAPDKLATLFNKFTQADASTTRRFGGTGLGLSICRELAGLMGGGIAVASTPGEGSVFTTTLKVKRIGPPRAAPPPPSPETAATAPDTAALRVLIAEDNPVNQLVVTTLLRQAGVDPTVVDNGAMAVEAWAAADWDLILMDVQMPVMDGLEATRQIREREREAGRARTPIVALTANAMSHQVAEYLAAGMDGHIAKPIEARALFEALSRHALELAERPADPAAGDGAVQVA